MMAKLRKQRGGAVLSILGVWAAVLLLVSPVDAAAKFKVDAAWNSTAGEAVDQFDYDPETGLLSMLAEQGQSKTLASFGEIKGLRSSDMEILASTNLHGGEQGKTPALLIRHGNWVSVIDPVSDRPIATNLGPIQAAGAHGSFTKLLQQPDGSVIAVFSGSVVLNESAKRGLEPVLFIYNGRTNQLGWLTIRSDAPDALPVAFAVLAEDSFSISAKYKYTSVNEKKKNSRGEAVVEKVVKLYDGELIIDLKSGQVVQKDGAGILDTKHTTSLTKTALKALVPAGTAHTRFTLPLSATDLLYGANSADPMVREAAIAKARADIDAQRAFEPKIRQALAPMLGQEEVVDELVRFAQAQSDAEGHATIMLAGPTGTGKTSGFKLFIEGWRNALGKKPAEIFYMSLGDVGDVKLLESFLKGSTPPYVGADTPSRLVLWMLDHPEGGGIFFDEMEKAEPAVAEKLMSYFELGEISITPHLVKALCKKYEDVPKENWPPALREATKEGETPEVSVTIKLNKNHIIGIGTNAGSEIFGDTGRGKALTSDQDLMQANRRFNADLVKSELKGKGYKPEVINRIQRIFAFKKILKKDHVRIVQMRMRDVEKKFAKKLIDFRFTEGARKFLEDETYDPSAGARNIAGQLEAWITQSLNDAVLSRSLINPGDSIMADVDVGNGSTKASILKLQKNGVSEALAQYQVGKPLPPNPAALLERARKNLKPTLEKRIVGHRKEIELLTNAILKKLALAVADPRMKGRPVVVYFDGTPGIGKTEIAKAVAEALFDDASRLTRVDFNEIVDMNTLYRFGIGKMTAAIKTSPESQVMLWDELHRLAHTPASQLIENTLMGVIDEGKLPAAPDSAEKVDMPAATVIIATGNLLEQALRPGARSMNNRTLHAEFRLLMRHPEAYLAVFEKTFGGAFRSRLGAPLMFSPLTDDEVAIIRDRIFEQNTKLIRDNGVTPVLTDSAKEFFLSEYVPMEGGRWLRRTLELYVENALVTMLIGSENKYQGSTMEVRWDEAARALKVDVRKDGKAIETQVLAEVPRSKSDYHPAVKEKTAWKTSIHEAGHAIVRGVLYGIDSIAEINTFGGGEGGWMERNTSAPGEEMYHGTKSGIKSIAVSLAGHIAELKYLGVSANGASSDFEHARQVAQTMLIDGSMPDIAPIALIKNPSTGKIDMSEKKKEELEKKVEFIVEYSARVARMILDRNEKAHVEVAKALHTDEDMHMTGRQFADLARGQVMGLSEADMELARKEAVAAVGRKASWSCETLLVAKDFPAPLAPTSAAVGANPSSKGSGVVNSMVSKVKAWFGK